ncbi:hypothetical protein Glove_86g151 [Diversispora epigaea]|uniref:Uncharacterized protein n=1 Tax=Diversispora epigaea TaxID=1348612 RepID=A0A397JB22_9GLOM|nr:hypothetical protein Glove_86g151 [Diversispora epigaea]
MALRTLFNLILDINLSIQGQDINIFDSRKIRIFVKKNTVPVSCHANRKMSNKRFVENIQLENVYNILGKYIQLRNDENTISIEANRKDASISNSASAESALDVLGIVGETVQPYIPLDNIYF